jgi:hypothetical protein
MLSIELISLGFLLNISAFQNQVHHQTQEAQRGISYDPIPPKAGRLDHKFPAGRQAFGNRITDAARHSDTG